MMDWEKDMEYDSSDMERDSSDMEHDSSDMEHDSCDSDNLDLNSDDSYDSLLEMQNDSIKLKHVNNVADILEELCGDHFFAEGELRCTDISMKVEGIGNLTFPLKDDSIKKLISKSTKPRSRKGKKTVLNKDVPNAHQIPGKNLNVQINKKSFTQMLDKMREEMEFSENCALEAELHNMLIYSQDEFSDFHQASEKAENMIGHLVVILPSPHVGGNLVIQHIAEKHTFSSENVTQKNFKCVGFNVDCKHKTEKVRDGFRVALMYKLILKSKKDKLIEHVNDNLKDAIQNYFVNLQTDTPKIVYFLDHNYSEHSLRWNKLKGEDSIRGTALFAVGKSLGLKPYLALLTVHHTNGIGRNGYQAYDPKGEYILSHWINSNNESEPFGDFHVYKEEICWTKETSVHFKPSEKDYDEDEGDTMHYWYKRAAAVLWPASNEVLMKFTLNSWDAFKELRATMESAGKENEVKEIVRKCGKVLYCRCRNEKCDFEKMIQIARYINDKEMSLPILSHFNWSILNSDISENLAKLESQYGDVWCVELLNKWKSNEVKSRHSSYANKESTLKKLSNFVEKYAKCGGNSKVVEVILDEQFRKISPTKKFERYSSTKLEDALVQYVDILYEFVISCTLIENTELIDKIMQCLVSSSLLSINTCLTELYLKLRKAIHANYLVHCEPLKTYLISSTKAELAANTQSKNNWSIKDQLKCQCKNCKEVNSFLLSNTEKKKEWKLLKKHREHLNIQLGRLNLPVTVSVETKGRPQKVTLVKNDILHNVDSKKIDELQLRLKNLQSKA